MKLLTYQAPGHDITKEVEPLACYTDPMSYYYELAQLLGYPSWLWAFENLHDFTSELAERWMIDLTASGRNLWVLDVPQNHIVWTGLEAYCENSCHPPLADNHTQYRDRGDIPMALVSTPIPNKWVAEVCLNKQRTIGHKDYPRSLALEEVTLWQRNQRL